MSRSHGLWRSCSFSNAHPDASGCREAYCIVRPCPCRRSSRRLMRFTSQVRSCFANANPRTSCLRLTILNRQLLHAHSVFSAPDCEDLLFTALVCLILCVV